MATSKDPPQALMRRHLVVEHPSRPAVLVEGTAAGALRLPFLDEPDGDPRQVGAVARHLGPGLELASLGEFAAVWTEPERAVGGIASEYLMLCEFRVPPPEALLERYGWCASSDDVELRPEFAEALDELLSGLAAPDGRTQFGMLPPHCLPGATAALDHAISGAFKPHPSDALAGALSGFEQVQAWVLSSVWLSESRVAKVTTPLWPQEPAVTELLHAWAPETVPAVLARGELRVARAGRAAPWMVCQRYRPLPKEQEPASAAVFEALAGLQACAVGRERRLLQAGAPERGPLAVAAELGVLWEEAASAGLAQADLSRLQRLEEWLAGRLQALATVAPKLLTHGDLHRGNALSTLDAVHEAETAMSAAAGGHSGYEARRVRTVIFDWTDAALAWPGVDILTMAPLGLSREQHSTDLQAVKAQYLDAVRAAFGQPAHADLLQAIEESVDEGLDLALVYHAVSYAHIVRSVPERQKAFVGRRFLVRAVKQLLGQLEGSTA